MTSRTRAKRASRPLQAWSFLNPLRALQHADSPGDPPTSRSSPWDLPIRPCQWATARRVGVVGNASHAPMAWSAAAWGDVGRKERDWELTG